MVVKDNKDLGFESVSCININTLMYFLLSDLQDRYSGSDRLGNSSDAYSLFG